MVAVDLRSILAPLLTAILASLWSTHVNGWVPSFPARSWRLCAKSSPSSADATSFVTAKGRFLDSLDCLDRLNENNNERTTLLNEMISAKVEVPVLDIVNGAATEVEGVPSIEKPGLWESMQSIAGGNWKVIYAPHMTTMAKVLGGGEFRVSYLLNDDGTMTSHARLDFPWLFGQKCLYLSVSGTYGSVSDFVCRVDFDEAWVKTIPNDGQSQEDAPYQRLADLPSSWLTESISRLGRLFFIEQVSVFPISFMDNELIVFDFELLGTRICARKEPSELGI